MEDKDFIPRPCGDHPLAYGTIETYHGNLAWRILEKTLTVPRMQDGLAALQEPRRLVDHATETAELFIRELEQRGWLLKMPHPVDIAEAWKTLNDLKYSPKPEDRETAIAAVEKATPTRAS